MVLRGSVGWRRSAFHVVLAGSYAASTKSPSPGFGASGRSAFPAFRRCGDGPAGRPRLSPLPHPHHIPSPHTPQTQPHTHSTPPIHSIFPNRIRETPRQWDHQPQHATYKTPHKPSPFCCFFSLLTPSTAGPPGVLFWPKPRLRRLDRGEKVASRLRTK